MSYTVICFHNSCMARNSRVLSPHLSIYKPQLTSVLSIMHRIFGAMAFFVLCVNHVLLYMAETNIDCAQKIFHCWIFHALVFVFSVAMTYHILNGLRYLFLWGVLRDFSHNAIRMSAVMVLLLFVVFSFVLGYVIFFVCQ